MFHPTRILHPTDYSAFSAYALGVATDLARQHGSRLLILHVAETLGPANVTYGEVGSELEPAGYQRRLWADLKRHVPASSGVDIEYLLGEGDPAMEIARIAAEKHCDLIVVGTHGRSGVLERLFKGSVTNELIHLAPCPVLVTNVSKPAVHGVAS